MPKNSERKFLGAKRCVSTEFHPKKKTKNMKKHQPTGKDGQKQGKDTKTKTSFCLKTPDSVPTKLSLVGEEYLRGCHEIQIWWTEHSVQPTQGGGGRKGPLSSVCGERFASQPSQTCNDPQRHPNTPSEAHPHIGTRCSHDRTQHITIPGAQVGGGGGAN